MLHICENQILSLNISLKDFFNLWNVNICIHLKHQHWSETSFYIWIQRLQTVQNIYMLTEACAFLGAEMTWIRNNAIQYKLAWWKWSFGGRPLSLSREGMTQQYYFSHFKLYLVRFGTAQANTRLPCFYLYMDCFVRWVSLQDAPRCLLWRGQGICEDILCWWKQDLFWNEI